MAVRRIPGVAGHGPTAARGPLAALLAAGLAAGTLLAVPAAAADQAGTAGPATGPACAPLLSAPAGGEPALAELGDRLGAAAAVNAVAPERLASLLRKDASARLDTCGALLFVEPAAPAGAKAPAAGSPAAGAAGLEPPGDAFALHSRPGSARTLYLDFTGFRLAGTAWNAAYPGVLGADYTLAPFSADADGSTFTAEERDRVRDAWTRVAEDYAPFDVDVTTEDPGQAAITRDGAGDTRYGTRVVVTGDTTVQGVCGCGGVSYVGVFDWASAHDYYQPALVFAAGLADDSKAIGEAAAHEAGHTLGLSHDGQGSQGYYRGHGAWAPVMGVGYDRPVTQWSRGEYSGATNTEDDLAVIGAHGLDRVADDYPDTVAAGAPVAPGTPVDGVVSSDADVDVFRFTTSGGAVTATATALRSGDGADLDVALTLLDGAGTAVSSADPPAAATGQRTATGLDAQVAATLPAGTYAVRVEGTGYASPASTGYSGYGSLGTYRLLVQAPADGYAPLAAPVRLMDTRPGQATVDGRFAGAGRPAAGQVAELAVAGRGGVPAGAAAVVLNVTAVQADYAGFVTVFPCGAEVPVASNLNFAAGQTVPNLVVARLGDGGRVCVRTAAPAHLVVDASGYFPGTTALAPLSSPVRLMDTRPGQATVDGQAAGIGTRAAGQVTELVVAGRGGIPADAAGAVLNVTVVGPAYGGYATVYPCGAGVPAASSVNFAAGQTAANAVLARIGESGRVCVRTAVPAHVVVDASGYFPGGGSLDALDAPVRLMDTRAGQGTVDGLYEGQGLRWAGLVTELVVAGRGGIGAGASTAVLNVTATEASGRGYVTVFPCGEEAPTASSLNLVAGATVANAVVARLGPGGRVCLLTSAGTHLVVDASGTLR